MLKYSITDREICEGKQVYTTWKQARRVLNNMRGRLLDRKSALAIYKCRVDNHYHIGSVTIRDRHIHLEDIYENDEESSELSISRGEEEIQRETKEQ